MNTAISVQNIAKKYHLYDNHTDRLKEALHPLRKKYYHDFYALRNIDFQIKKGETVGIIGRNGAGKSTLLKILTGVLTPSEGKFTVNGKISSILELGAGFNPELSGLENIEFYGTITGYKKNETDAKLSEILEFAQLGEFIHQPIRTYSSGMQMRLAFSIAIHTDPDILIIDEAFAVGDVRFQQKCFRKILEFQEAGKTILLVTHDTGAVINHCSRAIWLEGGEIVADGLPEKVCKEYVTYMFYDRSSSVGHNSNAANVQIDKCSSQDLNDVAHCDSFGEGGATILGTGLFSAETGEKLTMFRGGERVRYIMKFRANEDISLPIVGFILSDKYANKLLGVNSFILNEHIGELRQGTTYLTQFYFQFPHLMDGEYVFTCAIANGTQDNHVQHHWVHDAYSVKINGGDLHGRMGWYFPIRDGKIELDIC